MIFYIVLSLLFVVSAWKWGDWKRWKEYYSSVLFFIAFNFLTGALLKDNPFWIYDKNPIFNNWINLIWSFFIFPSTILMFLPFYAKGFKKGFIGTITWIAIYCFLEWIFLLTGHIYYQNKWTYSWTLFHNCYQFLLIGLHFFHSIIAWILGLLMILLLHYIFRLHILF
jgi:hypothetical protein